MKVCACVGVFHHSVEQWRQDYYLERAPGVVSVGECVWVGESARECDVRRASAAPTIIPPLLCFGMVSGTSICLQVLWSSLGWCGSATPGV